MTDEQARILEQLRHAFEQGAIDETTFRSASEALRAQVVPPPREPDRGTRVAGEDAVGVGHRGVYVSGHVGGDIITGDLYFGPPVPDPDTALTAYLRALSRRSGILPLRGVDVGASDPGRAQQRLSLQQVYVSLETTDPVSQPAADLPAPRRASALASVATKRRVVLLGDPGSGKSTFLSHLAFSLAAQTSDVDAGWRPVLGDWPAAEAGLVPVLLALRELAASLPAPLPAQATPALLWQAIVDRLDGQNLGTAATAIHERLEEGKVLLMLDGLDELPGQALRAFVAALIVAFVERYPENRVIVTCRTLAYQEPAAGEPDLRLPAPLFATTELAPLSPEKVAQFIAAWHEELVRLDSISSADGAGLSARLLAAAQRPDLRPLAANPLLLTVMTLVHTHKGHLPDARALLFEEIIDMLLWRWDQVKAGSRGALPPLRTLLAAAGRGELDLKRLLWQLAYDAHSVTDPDEEVLATVSETTLVRALARLHDDDWNWAHRVVELIKVRAGLLLEQRPGVFSFPHRAFQEYLAGACLSVRSDFARHALALAADDALWHEVICLAVGRLVYLSGDVDKPLALAHRLCPEEPDDAAATWRRATLAGELLLEIGRQRVADDDWGQELLARAGERLAELVGEGRLGPRARAHAGDVLGALDDPRPGVGLISVDGALLPSVEFCYVPPGPFWMGSSAADADGGVDEQPLHLVDVPYGYWLARYPLTVAPFRHFLEESGPRLAYDWQALEVPANRPLQAVSWADALVFCDWLHARWQALGWLPAGFRLTLPSEAEWEKGARGGVRLPRQTRFQWAGHGRLRPPRATGTLPNPRPQRIYPWGDEIDADRANYDEMPLTGTTAVGAFPRGASPYGLLDAAGNVLEWTRSLYSRRAADGQEQYFAYPYDSEDGRETLEAVGNAKRVVRGGFYLGDATWLRCAHRYGWTSEQPLFTGVRLAVVPIHRPRVAPAAA